MRKYELFLLICSFFLGFLIFGCVSFQKIDIPLQTYVDEVQVIIDSHCKESDYFNPNTKIIRFGHLEKRTVGLCTVVSNKYEIIIDIKSWKKYSNDERFQLIAHEMSHCMFFEEHNSDPRHYMYYELRQLSKEVVVSQIKELLEQKCNK